MTKYNTTTEGNCLIIKLSGDIDMQTSPDARAQILAALNDKHHVLVEMSAVEYIDSSGIANLVEGYQTAKSNSLTFVLFDISQMTRQVLELAKLDQIFPIFDSVNDALSEIGE